MLLKLDGRPLCVGQLARSVDVTSAAATYHVGRMRDAGLVVTEHRGRTTLVRRVERSWQMIIQALATAAVGRYSSMRRSQTARP